MGRARHRGSIDLVDRCYSILEEIQPATVRAVCYRLFVAGHIPDMSASSVRRVGRNLTRAREEGDIDWSWIVDETREVERTNSFDDLSSYARAVQRSYRRNLWSDQESLVEVWSEKGTVRGTLAPVLNEFGVPFRVQHGFGSATSVHQAARDSDAKRIVALYVGDWDPSGMHMSEVDLPDRLERYGGTVEIIRIAIIDVDVAGLPTFSADTKRTDARYDWFVQRYGRECCELDALPPPILRERLRDEIASRIDHVLWDRAMQVEKAEMESVDRFFRGWSGILTPNPK